MPTILLAIFHYVFPFQQPTDVVRRSNDSDASVYIGDDASEDIAFRSGFLLDTKVGRDQAKEGQDTHFS